MFFNATSFFLTHLMVRIQAQLRDIAHLFTDHRDKVNMAIKQVTSCGFPVHVRVLCIL